MKLALFELRRFRRAPLSRVALAVLTLIPLLYGALYLWAFWDPYGNLDRIPVALVNEDKPATAATGTAVHAGRDLADELIDRRVFAWHQTSYAAAEKGLADGEYHLLFRIPRDFSTSLASPLKPGTQPEQAKLVVETDDATNYLSGLLARSAFTEIRGAAAKTASKGYFDRMLISFGDIKAKTQQAAGGAGQLADGTRKAHTGAAQAADGADQAHRGAGQLANGLTTANQGASDLANGLSTLNAGTAQLADGSAQVAAGTQLLATKVDAIDAAGEPVLRANWPLIQQAARLIAAGASAAADHAAALPGAADAALTDVTSARDALAKFLESPPILLLPDQRRQLEDALAKANTAVATARTLHDAVYAVDIPTLRDQLRQLADTANRIADAAPHLADDLGAARRQVDRLNTGAHTVAAGADQLHRGAAKASGGAQSLTGGLYRLSTGARQLDSGLASLSSGTHQLADGLSTLQNGAGQLADGLSDGAKQIPGYDADARARQSGVLGDPVELDRHAHHAAATYGVGFAPYFLALALWVGAMITYMLLRPVTRRHQMSAAPPQRVAFAGWLPAAIVGLIQSVVLFLVLRFALGLVPVHALWPSMYLVLASVTFVAIMQWLGAPSSDRPVAWSRWLC